MKRRDGEDALGLMNAAVGLVIVVPILLLAADAVPRSPRQQPAPPPVADQPPIITISDAEVFSFPSGTATLTPELETYVSTTLIPTLAEIAARYGCDVVEVIGHTDSQRVRTVSNLDTNLLPSLANRTRVLTPGSNPDLGLMRAWAVIRVLEADVRLVDKRLYGYSAGDAILPSGARAQPVERPEGEPARRRIELRLRRSR